MPPPDITVRGIRGPIPPGYVLGRQSAGMGPPELIRISDLTTPSSTGSDGTPYLSVYLNAAQSFSSGGSPTQIHFDTVNADTASAWSAVTHRFTPTKAGRYLVSVGFNIIDGADCSAGGYLGLIQLRKSGTVYRKWATQAIAAKVGVATSVSGNIVVEIQMNGSTDYIDVAGYSEDSAPSFSGVAVGIQTYLEIHYIGP